MKALLQAQSPGSISAPGALVMSYVLVRDGQPPFVLTVENAAAYFGPSTVIRDIYKQSPTMLLRLPGIKRSLADILQAHADRRYLLAAAAAPTGGGSTAPSR
jgi:hypothetical protein